MWCAIGATPRAQLKLTQGAVWLDVLEVLCYVGISNQELFSSIPTNIVTLTCQGVFVCVQFQVHEESEALHCSGCLIKTG